MSNRADFLAWVDTRLRNAEVALLDGDAAPRREIWSQREPVSVFGAWKVAIGRQQVDEVFGWLTQRFSGCLSYEFEHVECTTDGVPTTFRLRATQIYRREEGEWKVAHRHADALVDQEPAE